MFSFHNLLTKKRIFEKSNTITAQNIDHGTIYQNCTINNITISDAATAVSANVNDPAKLKTTINSIAKVISSSNILPEGYTPSVELENGKAHIHSQTVSEEAKQLMPEQIKGKFKFKDSSDYSIPELFRRAQLSQTPIEIELIDIEKMIGNVIDPLQEDFQKNCKESTFKIIPPTLPPAKNCILGIKDTEEKYNNFLFRVQPVDPDMNILHLSNCENYDDLKIDLIYHLDNGKTDFTYSFKGTNWKQLRKFLKFMKAASTGATLYIYSNEDETDIFRTILQHALYDDEYDQLEGDLLFIRDLLLVEAYWGVDFDFNSEFDTDDMEIISFLSKSIRGEAEKFTWDTFSCNGVLTPQTDSADYNTEMTISFKSHVDLMVHGVTIPNLEIEEHLESAKFAHPDELKQVLENTPDTSANQISIELIPSESNNWASRKVIL